MRGKGRETMAVRPAVRVANATMMWMLHCHNTYHLETGMATVFSYRD